MSTSPSTSRNSRPTSSDGNVNRQTSGHTTTFGGRNSQPLDSLTRAIIQSSLYRSAYDLFSSDMQYGQQYLTQLEAIPYARRINDANFWDAASNFVGFTSSNEKAFTDAFNAAMTEIRSLITNYYSFINSLPESQVNQLRDAGINAAITGQGVSSSVMPTDGNIQPTPSMTEYNNTQFSQGITSFVEFIGSMSNLGKTIVDSKSIMGMLDIAERESYNKQELHDLLLNQLGITPSSKYSVLGDSGSISDIRKKGLADAKTGRIESEANARVYDQEILVPIGDDPNSVQSYEVMSGTDVLDAITRLKLATTFSEHAISSIRTQNQQLWADVLSTLDAQQEQANLEAGIELSGFNEDYYRARSGLVEGQSQTSIAESLQAINESESAIKAIEAWIQELKMSQLNDWATQVSEKPFLAPYLYKALFDFNMDDTFWNQSAVAQGVHHGLSTAEALMSIVGAFFGLKAPKIPTVRYSKTKTGPAGTTVSETIREVIE